MEKEYYYKYGQRYEGDMIDSLAEGKGIMFYINGDRYEGDFKNDKPDGKGIYYFKNGDREMGDYSKGKKINKHAKMDTYGSVTSLNY